jgi:flagellar biosynthesis/type III secretory pathway protein FliH
MSAVIKSGQTPAVTIGPAPVNARRLAPPPAPIDPERIKLRAECDRLAKQLAQTQADLERQREQTNRAFEDGRAAGFEAGRKERDEHAQEAHEALKAGIADAMAHFDQTLAGLESLSLAIAREGLEKVLGAAEAPKALLAHAIEHQMQGLGEHAAIRVEVSKADFPDRNAIDALATAIARPELEILAFDALAPGACRLRLALGALEIGVAQQWARLEDLLHSFAGGPDA